MKTLLFIPGLKTTKISLIKENNWNFEEIKKVEIEIAQEENRKIFNFLHSIDLKEIEKIVFCNWPWRFMSLRICWTIIKTLKNQFPNIKIFQIPTYEFLQSKSQNSTILLQLNQTEVLIYSNKKTKKINFETLKSKDHQLKTIKWFWNVKQKLKLPENFLELSEELNDLEILWEFLNEKYEVEDVKINYN